MRQTTISSSFPLIVLALSSYAGAAPAQAIESCEFVDIAGCTKLCAQGDLKSCYFHARHLSGGMGIPQDEAKAHELFREGCESGYGDSCNAVGVDLLKGERSDEAVLRALPSYERACKLGSSKGCDNAANPLRRESLGRVTESHSLFIRACEMPGSGSTVGCNEAAENLREGAFGNPVDKQRAAQLYRRSCELGDQAACASATALGLPSSLSPTDAARLRTEACRKQGDLLACAMEGVALRDGKGVGRDIKEAVRLFDLVCAGGVQSAFGCDEAGSHRLNGDLGSIDIDGAVPFLRKACEARKGRAGACRRLADLSVMGQGVKQDRAEAIRLYQRACDLQAPEGCQQAGALTNLDPSASAKLIAEQLFALGCNGGDDESCRAMERAGFAKAIKQSGEAQRKAGDVEECESTGRAGACYEAGLRAKKAKEYDKARRYYDIACRGGIARGCNGLAICAGMGWGGPKDPDLEIESMARACVLGAEGACAPAVARLGVAKFSAGAKATARKILEDGCRAGVKGACE